MLTGTSINSATALLLGVRLVIGSWLFRRDQSLIFYLWRRSRLRSCYVVRSFYIGSLILIHERKLRIYLSRYFEDNGRGDCYTYQLSTLNFKHLNACEAYASILFFIPAICALGISGEPSRNTNNHGGNLQIGESIASTLQSYIY